MEKMNIRAVVINGSLVPVDPAHRIKIDPILGYNTEAYTYRIVDLESLTDEERAAVQHETKTS